MNWLNKLERKYGKYVIPNLIWYVIVLNIVGFVIYYGVPQIEPYLGLSIEAVLRGEVWRLLSFVLIPPVYSIVGMVFFVLFYYWIGTGLEQAWGAFRFNVYLFTGVILHILAAFLIYFIFHVDLMLNLTYLNVSLFLAFGAEYPEHTIYVMFILPVKMKYMAAISGIFLGVQIISGLIPLFTGNFASTYQIAGSIGALVAVGNFLIYFLNNRNYVNRRTPQQRKIKKNLQKASVKVNASTRHRCAVCGRTEETNPELEFRYCSKCTGAYEYCMDHLYTHVHVNDASKTNS